jgi:hypothetical protein
MSDHRGIKILQFRSTPNSGADIFEAGSWDEEGHNQKIIEKYTNKGIIYSGQFTYTKKELVKQARICVAIWAVAYEFLSVSFVSDAKFDEICLEVERDLDISTDNPKLDKWYKNNFQAHTGAWIHGHPDLEALKKRARYLIWARDNPLGK